MICLLYHVIPLVLEEAEKDKPNKAFNVPFQEKIRRMD